MAGDFDPEALATEYQRLGGTRKVLDLGKPVIVAPWNAPEPEAAQLFWLDNVQTLAAGNRIELARYLAAMD